MEETKVNRLKEYTTNEDLDVTRPSYLEIDLNAFDNNFHKIKKLAGPDVSLMAVVKANAYGHGSIGIAKQAQKLGADFLGVAFIEEGEKLLDAGIAKPIVVLYPDMPERAARLVRAGLIATVDSPEYLQALNAASENAGVVTSYFIKAETGMARYGVSSEQLNELLKQSSKMRSVKFIGITTNLADSSNGDKTFTAGQFKTFSDIINNAGLHDKPYLSIENSSGLLFHHDKYFNLARVGLLMYGYSPKNAVHLKLEPIMSLKSRIISLKHWAKGRPVGYGGKYIAEKDMLLATVGVGYADGYPWSLSNKSEALIGGKRARVIGRVCMDALMIDVTDIPGVAKGDEVVLMGKSGDDIITADELGELSGSFSYEIISGMSSRLPRKYIGG